MGSGLSDLKFWKLLRDTQNYFSEQLFQKYYESE